MSIDALRQISSYPYYSGYYYTYYIPLLYYVYVVLHEAFSWDFFNHQTDLISLSLLNLVTSSHTIGIFTVLAEYNEGKSELHLKLAEHLKSYNKTIYCLCTSNIKDNRLRWYPNNIFQTHLFYYHVRYVPLLVSELLKKLSECLSKE